MSVFKSKNPSSILFRFALGLGAVSVTAAVGLFAYLGTFTRYLADDYCETVLARDGLLKSLIHRYETISDRFSNLLFVGLLEYLTPHNVQAVPVVMILFWVAALTWLVYEVRRLLNLQWTVLLDFFLAASLAFFCILEAPNRFQTIYWRSAMATHFAPLVYLTAFVALLLMWIRGNENRRPAIWMGVICLVIAFFGGGFSEPPDALLIVSSVLMLAAVWAWEKGPRRRPAMMLLSWTLAGGLLALFVLMAAPGNSFRIRTARPDLVELVVKTLLATFQFILDSLAILPTPSLVSVALPLLLFFGLFGMAPALSSRGKRMMWLTIAIVPVLTYGLIVAAFAPSVYGQAFPAERARFIGCMLMIVGLMLEGACFGVILAQWKMRWLPAGTMIAMILFVLFSVYPLRSAWNVVQEKRPYYQLWSSLWDKRQEKIMADKAKGMNDILAANLYSIEGIEELSTNPKDWVNVCAADYYGVQSIRVP